MGLNSTDTAYNFGQFGSTFLKGDGAKLLLTASTAKYYICAITMVTDVAFQALESLDGGVAVDSETFPKGVTIYGRWTGFQLATGGVIAYVGY